MTNEQFDIISGHLGSIALSLKELAQHVGEMPLPTADVKRGASDHTGWRAVVIPFGKKKGERLGDLHEKSLEWWITDWHPKPYFNQNGEERPPSKADLALRKALDEAAAELGVKPTDKPAPGAAPAEAPRAPAAPRPAPAPQQDTNDEDVPF